MQIPCGGVAFFDSGIGGLTVLSECRRKIPWGDFYYFGDNARAPYGNLPPERIYSYVDEAFSFFDTLRVRAAVIACNTATAVCVERLRSKYAFPIIGAEPAVLPAAKCGGRVLVLSTLATSQSERFIRLCDSVKRAYPSVELIIRPLPDLAGIIEKNVLNPSFTYDEFLPRENPSSVVLGCTHYVYIKKQIQRFYSCPVFDGNLGIANRLFSVLSTPQNTPILEKSREERPLVTTARPPKNWHFGSEKSLNIRIYEQMFAK